MWTTDKDGIILGLLAAEITAVEGKDPGELYSDLTEQFGAPVYERIDAPANPDQKAILSRLSPDAITQGACGRSNRGNDDLGSRQRRAARRFESFYGARMVCSATFRY